MNAIEIILIIVLVIFLYNLIPCKKDDQIEGLDASDINNEALQNIASIYNDEDAALTNLRVTDTANATTMEANTMKVMSPNFFMQGKKFNLAEDNDNTLGISKWYGDERGPISPVYSRTAKCPPGQYMAGITENSTRDRDGVYYFSMNLHCRPFFV